MSLHRNLVSRTWNSGGATGLLREKFARDS